MSNNPLALTLPVLLFQADAPKVLLANVALGPVGTDVLHNMGYAATGYFVIRSNAPVMVYDDDPAFNQSSTTLRLLATAPCIVTLLVF